MKEQDNLYKALKEVSIVLEYTDPTLKGRVHKNFIWFMDTFKDESHYFRIDTRKPLKDQDLMYESIVILSIILKSDWWDKETEKLLTDKHINRERFYGDVAQTEHNLKSKIGALTIVKKESIFSRMVKSIKRFFGWGKGRLYLPE